MLPQRDVHLQYPPIPTSDCVSVLIQQLTAIHGGSLPDLHRTNGSLHQIAAKARAGRHCRQVPRKRSNVAEDCLVGFSELCRRTALRHSDEERTLRKSSRRSSSCKQRRTSMRGTSTWRICSARGGKSRLFGMRKACAYGTRPCWPRPDS